MQTSFLPIDDFLSAIVNSVKQRHSVVLTATPGAGKTTRLPPQLLGCVTGQVLVLQPRRMAAVAACHRVCEENGWTVGQEAGYQVRFDSKVGPATRLIFMTDALLLRRLVDDPELQGIDLVVIDEFHERNLNQDLILGYLREMQELGRPLKMVIMSATLEAKRLSQFLLDCEVIDVPGKVYPLDLRHQNQSLSLRTDGAFYHRVVDAVFAAEQETQGDILVFLPGTGEIQRVRERLIEAKLRSREVVELHGSLSLEQQQKVLRVSQSPRVILSTNVAEASVTVPGVDYVIDTGLAKVMQTHPRTGFSQLELSRISLFSAHQRAGRAARQKAGVCLRLWTIFEEQTQAQESVPECQRAELTQTMLLLTHLGVTQLNSFSWYDHPPASLVSLARQSLLALRAINDDGQITAFGRRLLRYPLPPRWGGLLALGEDCGMGQLAANAAAILSERDFVDRERFKTSAPSLFECDLRLRLDLLADFEHGRPPGYVNVRTAQAVLETARQLRGMVDQKSSTKGDLSRLLLGSQGDRLCRRRAATPRALMSGRRGVRLADSSQVRTSEFFIALQGMDLPNQSDTQITLASGFSKARLLEELGDKVEVAQDVWYDPDKEVFFNRRVRTIGSLPIEEPTLTPALPEVVAGKMVEILVQNWSQLTQRHKGLLAWLERWRFFVRHRPEHASELNAEAIKRCCEMAGYGRVRLSDVLEQDLAALIEMALPSSLVRDFDREVPSFFCAPSGLEHLIVYGDLHSAYVDVRLQEMFGLLTTPRILFGQVPLTFRLLGPNFRPVQVTSDLASFWKNGYPEVRKDLRARYPKHSWPENPLTAKPEAKGRRRS